MFEGIQRPLLSPRRFAGRMAAFVLAALFVDGVALGAGAIGYHFLEGLDWLDASLNAALVMTGNGPIHSSRTPGGELFTLFDALLGSIVFVAVIGVILTPVFHRTLHAFHRLHRDDSEDREQQTVAPGEQHPVSAEGQTRTVYNSFEKVATGAKDMRMTSIP
jgi:hypothetical protein